MTLTDRQLRWREYRDDYLADNRGMFDSDEGRIADEAADHADRALAKARGEQ